jgi:hypothetical protein
MFTPNNLRRRPRLARRLPRVLLLPRPLLLQVLLEARRWRSPRDQRELNLFCSCPNGTLDPRNPLKLADPSSRDHGWHAFRRAVFVTNLFHKDVKEVTVQSLMGHKKRLQDHSRTLHPTAGRQRENRRDPAQLDCWYGNGTGDFPCNSLKSW